MNITALQRLLLLSTLLISTSLILSCGSTPTKESPKAHVDTAAASSKAETTLKTAELSRFKDAIAKLNSGKTKEALRQLKKLHKAEPNHIAIAANLASAEFIAGNNKEALKIVQTIPNSALAQNVQGLIALQNNNISGAEKAFQRAITLDDKFTFAYFNLALIYDTYYQDLKNAVKYYQAFLVLTDFKDKETQAWVKELERSIKNDT